MKVYLVGGAVRDELMGVDSKDRDYVVVGSTHEEMIALGYTQVGAAFPVYLNPQTKEEYALARTEKSTGPGYHDFEVVFGPEVTLEEDLYRRDLTINAIAKDLDTGEYIDPFFGQVDIRHRTLRPVSEDSFKEDPLRIYRLARFAARYSDFSIAGETYGLCRKASGGLPHLPKERKFAEINKCFSDTSAGNKPSKMIELLVSLGEFPELRALLHIPQPEKHHAEGDPFIHTMMVLDAANDKGCHPETQWACLCHDLGKVCYDKFGNLHGHEAYGVPIAEQMCERYGVPKYWKRLALVVTENHGRMHKVLEMTPKKVYNLMQRISAEKDSDFAHKFMDVAVADSIGRLPSVENYPQAVVMTKCMSELKNNMDDISEECSQIAKKFAGRPELIRDNVTALKVRYVARALKDAKSVFSLGGVV